MDLIYLVGKKFRTKGEKSNGIVRYVRDQKCVV